MFFIAYGSGSDSGLQRFPFFTLFVCLTCLFITYLQERNEAEIHDTIVSFCAEKPSLMYRLAMSRTTDPRGQSCTDLMTELSWTDDRDAIIWDVAEAARYRVLTPEAGRTEVEKQLRQRFAMLEVRLPEPLTRALWYMPDSWHPGRMLTSTFAHDDWDHIAGNVYFFFAFGAAVEVIVGAARLAMTFLFVAFGTSIAYSISMAGGEAIPTLGLSGVVYGTMGALFVLAPRLDMRCVLWFFVLFKRFSIPVWMLFVWFFGWDTYYLWTAEDEYPETNLVAHVSGAVLGCIVAVAFKVVPSLRVEGAAH